MTEGNWDVSGVDAEFVDVPLGGVWTAPDGGRYRCVGGGCGRCAFLRPPIRVGKTGVETTCANQVDADSNGGDRLACFSFERRDGVDVRFERVKETEPTMSDATKSKRKSSVGGWLQGVAAWFGERWAEEPGSVVLAVVALVWLALTVAKVFG
ncbi:MAG: hypothetical protein J6K20_06610 [Thermoguttaceae bacterium]|nr:hypothetical protein [Thermoguttaceae bacterium]